MLLLDRKLKDVPQGNDVELNGPIRNAVVLAFLNKALQERFVNVVQASVHKPRIGCLRPSRAF